MLEFRTIKVISLGDLLGVSGEERGAGCPIWDEVRNHYHGNQMFNNNSLFIYTFPSINGEELSLVQQRIFDLCEGAVEDDTVVFEVDW